jgi:DNA-directed RNA polymerase sigma subunit (sigma70/sigma32)
MSDDDGVEEALRTLLTPREEQILRLRYGMGCSALATAEIGLRLAITQARAAQLVTQALGKFVQKLKLTPIDLVRLKYQLDVEAFDEEEVVP